MEIFLHKPYLFYFLWNALDLDLHNKQTKQAKNSLISQNHKKYIIKVQYYSQNYM